MTTVRIPFRERVATLAKKDAGIRSRAVPPMQLTGAVISRYSTASAGSERWERITFPSESVR